MNIRETITGLETMLFDLHPQAQGIYKAIQSLQNVDSSENSLSDKSPTNGGISKRPYSINDSMRKKALLIIKAFDRFVKTREIAERIKVYEPKLELSDIIISLSNPLYYLKNENKVHKLVLGTGNRTTYWGSEKWLDQNGNPLPQHMYLEEEKEEEVAL